MHPKLNIKSIADPRRLGGPDEQYLEGLRFMRDMMSARAGAWMSARCTPRRCICIAKKAGKGITYSENHTTRMQMRRASDEFREKSEVNIRKAGSIRVFEPSEP